MADTEDEEFAVDDDTGQGSEYSGSKKKVLLILSLVLLLSGGGAGVYYSGILEDDDNDISQSEKPAAPPLSKSVYLDLPDMLVNLNSISSTPHYLKFRASLELGSSIDATALKPLEPRIIDKFQVYMRELRLEDFRANGGFHGLREEMLARINDAINPIRVKDVLFSNLLVQ